MVVERCDIHRRSNATTRDTADCEQQVLHQPIGRRSVAGIGILTVHGLRAQFLLNFLKDGRRPIGGPNTASCSRDDEEWNRLSGIEGMVGRFSLLVPRQSRIPYRRPLVVVMDGGPPWFR